MLVNALLSDLKKKEKIEEQKKPSKAILLWEKEDPHHQIANSY